MKLKHFLLIVLVMSIIWQFSLKADAPLKISILKKPDLTIGWVGDMVPNESDMEYNSSAFAGVAPELRKPDLMIGNLEGTFAHADRVSKCVYIASMCHAFAGQPIFADSIKDAGFDVVSLVNNHSYDFGDEGLLDTEAELDRVGIPYISPTKPTLSISVHGKRVGIVGVSSTPPLETINDYAYIQKTVSELKANNDIVVLIMHGGAEGADKTGVPGTYEWMGTENRGNVELVAKTAIDAGADLVLGSGPHVLRKIEIYKDKPIAYSLGNFVSGKHLITKGILSVSGIFTASFTENEPTAFNFISIKLSDVGLPFIDLTDAGKDLIETLSGR